MIVLDANVVSELMRAPLVTADLDLYHATFTSKGNEAVIRFWNWPLSSSVNNHGELPTHGPTLPAFQLAGRFSRVTPS